MFEYNLELAWHLLQMFPFILESGNFDQLKRLGGVLGCGIFFLFDSDRVKVVAYEWKQQYFFNNREKNWGFTFYIYLALMV